VIGRRPSARLALAVARQTQHPTCGVHEVVLGAARHALAALLEVTARRLLEAAAGGSVQARRTLFVTRATAALHL